jgi:hypothetical protein
MLYKFPPRIFHDPQNGFGKFIGKIYLKGIAVRYNVIKQKFMAPKESNAIKFSPACRFFLFAIS